MEKNGSLLSPEDLRKKLVECLEAQGFIVKDSRITLPPNMDKNMRRALHSLAVKHKVESASPELMRHEDRYLRNIASGREVDPYLIKPILVEVKSGSQEEMLFRYACLHWSIPVSSGYGRRLRFLVYDESNGKLMGLFGLGDPVFSLAERDRWVGWDKETRRLNLASVMDAFVLGAVPPYSMLLCGKLMAMLVASNEVREAFEKKYGERRSLILGRTGQVRLAMVTTTSALGRSSVYSRLKYRGRFILESVGFTNGFGEFHFLNGLYKEITHYARENCKPSAKKPEWGKGFRNRREVIRKCLQEIGLNGSWLHHGVNREIFVAPLASNTREYLRGEEKELHPYDQPAASLFEWFRTRWLLPRAERDQSYRDFDVESYRLWPKE
jgi:hypothetical protein